MTKPLIGHPPQITTFRRLRARLCQTSPQLAQVRINLLINACFLISFTGRRVRILIQQNDQLTSRVRTLEDTITELKSLVMGFSSQLQEMATRMLPSSSAETTRA